MRTALALDPNHAFAAHGLGSILAERGDAVQAKPWLRRAVELAPGSAKVRRDLGSVLVFPGELDAARATLMEALALDPLADEAIDTLVRLRSMNDATPKVEALLATLDRLAGSLDQLPAENRSQVLFCPAKALEERGEYDQAFDCLARANAIRRPASDRPLRPRMGRCMPEVLRIPARGPLGQLRPGPAADLHRLGRSLAPVRPPPGPAVGRARAALERAGGLTARAL